MPLSRLSKEALADVNWRDYGTLRLTDLDSRPRTLVAWKLKSSRQGEAGRASDCTVLYCIPI
jgi:hypothetical protein